MENYLAVMLFTFTTMITPGPNNIMMMSSGLNYGVRKSLQHYLGICAGLPAMVAVIGLSFDLIFLEFPFLHDVIKVIGVSYLLYLSYRMATLSISSLQEIHKKPFTFMQAAAFQWVNPKAWTIGTGAIAAYTTDDGALMQVFYITLAFLLAAFPCLAAWLFFGANLKRALKNKFHQKLFNISMALLLALSVLPVITELVSNYLL